MTSSAWLPFTSDPEVMNWFLESVGIPLKWGVSDVVSLDDDLLGMIPVPSLAFILLLPTRLASEKMMAEGTQCFEKSSLTQNEPYFMRQRVKNACGPTALIHALCNNMQHLDLGQTSALAEFYQSTKNLTPEEKGSKLESYEAIRIAIETAVLQGRAKPQEIDEASTFHFIAFVNVEGTLYELDGRKQSPISHGPTSSETFIKDATRVCREFMDRDPDNLNFTVLSLGSMA